MTRYMPRNFNWWRKALEKAVGPVEPLIETETNKTMAALHLAKAVAACEVHKAYAKINAQKVAGKNSKVR